MHAPIPNHVLFDEIEKDNLEGVLQLLERHTFLWDQSSILTQSLARAIAHRASQCTAYLLGMEPPIRVNFPCLRQAARHNVDMLGALMERVPPLDPDVWRSLVADYTNGDTYDPRATELFMTQAPSAHEVLFCHMLSHPYTPRARSVMTEFLRLLPMETLVNQVRKGPVLEHQQEHFVHNKLFWLCVWPQVLKFSSALKHVEKLQPMIYQHHKANQDKQALRQAITTNQEPRAPFKM